MSRAVGLGFLLACALAAPASADYPAGVRAWGRGDFTAAAREFLPAAQAGDAESQYMMGRLYALGDGVPQDFVQAWAWFDKAAAQGHAEAGQARAGMEGVLTPEQLALGRAMNTPAVARAPIPAEPTQPPMMQPSQPVEGRRVVLVPRQGDVASLPPARRPTVNANPARLAAPAATAEGQAQAAGRLREQVRGVQRQLMAAGYFDGPADGALTPGTRRAIRDYQRAAGLPETGLLSHRMVEQLAQSDQQQAAR